MKKKKKKKQLGVCDSSTCHIYITSLKSLLENRRIGKSKESSVQAGWNKENDLNWSINGTENSTISIDGFPIQKNEEKPQQQRIHYKGFLFLSTFKICLWVKESIKG